MLLTGHNDTKPLKSFSLNSAVKTETGLDHLFGGLVAGVNGVCGDKPSGAMESMVLTRRGFDVGNGLTSLCRWLDGRRQRRTPSRILNLPENEFLLFDDFRHRRFIDAFALALRLAVHLTHVDVLAACKIHCGGVQVFYGWATSKREDAAQWNFWR